MKPRIIYWKGLWECSGKGLFSYGKSPKESYDRWKIFVTEMRADE